MCGPLDTLRKFVWAFLVSSIEEAPIIITQDSTSSPTLMETQNLTDPTFNDTNQQNQQSSPKTVEYGTIIHSDGSITTTI